MRRALLTIVLIVGFALQGVAQSPLGVAFYDVGAIYDTIPSKFYDDGDFTPQGRRHWDTERYRLKVENTAAVIDSMAMAVVALYGVENEQVVRDIALACKGDYAYVHCHQDSSSGLDFAMFYRADRFIPQSVTSWRGALCVEGSARGRELTIVAAYRSTSLGVLIEQRGLLDRGDLILLGRPSAAGFDHLGLRDWTLQAEGRGHGNVVSASRWVMRDRVLSTLEDVVQCDVYIKDWLLDRGGHPRGSFDGKNYYGGYSSALPVFVYF